MDANRADVRTRRALRMVLGGVMDLSVNSSKLAVKACLCNRFQFFGKSKKNQWMRKARYVSGGWRSRGAGGFPGHGSRPCGRPGGARETLMFRKKFPKSEKKFIKRATWAKKDAKRSIKWGKPGSTTRANSASCRMHPPKKQIHAATVSDNGLA